LKKTILITGSKGFIGSYLIRSLQNTYHCFGVSRSDNADITHYESLKALDVTPDIIIHAAASLGSDVEEAFSINVMGTLNICKYAKEKGAKHLILISSLSVYEREENEYFNIYGRTKKQSEEIAEAYCKEHGIALTILRLSQVYDDRGLAKKSQGMLYYFIETIQKEQKISIFGKKNPLRNYIHIDYLTAVVQDVIVRCNTGIYNIIEEKDHTISEIAYMIFDLLSYKPTLIFLEDKPDIGQVYIPHDKHYQSDIQPISLKEGIQRIIHYDR